MKCVICRSVTRFFFSKKFDVHGLGEVEYWRCGECGFVLSRTHAEMAPEEWEGLNRECHASYLGTQSDPGDPRWLSRLGSQAAVLDDAAQIGLLDTSGRWLDYACGDGKLSDLLRSRHGRELLRYDRYMRRERGYLDDGALTPRGFGLVVTTSVFEHLAGREQFDAIEALVSAEGVLGIHTLVCESVPADPSWFYLAPVHCAFHTNRSMELLFRQWGYRCSVYNVAAQLWLWFRDEPREIELLVQKANARPNGPSYVFKPGFVDYWKGSPLRRADEKP